MKTKYRSDSSSRASVGGAVFHLRLGLCSSLKSTLVPPRARVGLLLDSLCSGLRGPRTPLPSLRATLLKPVHWSRGGEGPAGLLSFQAVGLNLQGRARKGKLRPQGCKEAALDYPTVSGNAIEECGLPPV
ncbi:uncharacterized protein LOC119510385 isoform X5 [Choloepus didactylus]|uniref:uncharacterized protein LOC119510385 isoform X5 n=1 Tax=Choloepus didactylus TaxID=27675 RepID=UPI00189FF123|nr:uncharacterized protein LOC119510385 isoform X5 [Choloepus didactylus]